jgi:NAD(P)-dependent dehydrogenase (short-subunit alcohol dehydrogenase family)
MPRYGKHRATRQARVVLNGHTIYLGPFGTPESKEAYQRVINEINEWLARGRSLPKPGPAVVELILAFWKHANLNYRKPDATLTGEANCLLRSFNCPKLTTCFSNTDLKTGGRIIMIGSCLGERVFIPGMAPYSATKGAVKMFTQGLARELGARGITVNNVQPGPIDTDRNPASGEWAVGQKAAVPLDRYGHVDEVAALVAFVAGPESSFINGANLTVSIQMIDLV